MWVLLIGKCRFRITQELSNYTRKFLRLVIADAEMDDLAILCIREGELEKQIRLFM
jgi:hypothetical protein